MARDKLRSRDAGLYIFDMYNSDLWPADATARRGIDREVAYHSGIDDESYLQRLAAGLEGSFRDFSPDIVLYNAGTDPLRGDPLGRQERLCLFMI